MMPARESEWVVRRARDFGFDLCGIAPAQGLTELSRFGEWLQRGYAGEMRYLRDERRLDPGRVVPGARSIIVCGLNYNSTAPLSTEAAAQQDARCGPRGWISRYAWGRDYHEVVGEKLKQLAAALSERFGGDFAFRSYVDTGPVAERVAARHAGLGWLGKNTCLISEAMGSWLFLGVIVTTLPFSPSIGTAEAPPPDLCGNCRLCLDACPTGALVEPYVLDARRCISYLTIELRGSVPEEFRRAMGWHVFGCDICQDVCPWNRNAPSAETGPFAPHERLFAPELTWLLSLEREEFGRIFRGSAVRRAKWQGLVRNACIAAGNASARLNPEQKVRLRERLAQLAASDDGVVAEHARWALAQMGTAEG